MYIAPLDAFFLASEGDKNARKKRPIMVGDVKIVNAQKGVFQIPSMFGMTETNIEDIDPDYLEALIGEQRVSKEEVKDYDNLLSRTKDNGAHRHAKETIQATVTM